MTLKTYRAFKGTCLCVLFGAGLAVGLSSVSVHAQNSNPFAPAPAEAMDNLSEIGTPSGGAVSRARNTAAPGAGNAARDRIQANMRGGGAGGRGAVREAGAAVQRVMIPRVKAIMGTRVFDAVTGELLDDAQLQSVDQAEVQNLGLVDDGTKGDRLPDDGEYANVTESREYIGQANQRLKERLIQAIYSAEQLNPLDFYGFNIMTTERTTPAPRNRRWRLIDDPKGGPGRTLAEEATDRPLQVPKYREWEQERDRKIAGKDGWAVRFLDEYRVNKGAIDSEFYTIYIPQPPVPPGVPPPPGWVPFPNPSGAAEDPSGTAAGFSKQGYKIKAPPSGAAGGGGSRGGSAGGGRSGYFDRGNAAALMGR